MVDGCGRCFAPSIVAVERSTTEGVVEHEVAASLLDVAECAADAVIVTIVRGVRFVEAELDERNSRAEVVQYGVVADGEVRGYTTRSAECDVGVMCEAQ